MGAWGQVVGEETHLGNAGFETSIRHRELMLGGSLVWEWRPGRGHLTLERDRMVRG